MGIIPQADPALREVCERYHEKWQEIKVVQAFYGYLMYMRMVQIRAEREKCGRTDQSSMKDQEEALSLLAGLLSNP